MTTEEKRPSGLSGQHDSGRPGEDIQRHARGPSDILSWRGLNLQSGALSQVSVLVCGFCLEAYGQCFISNSLSGGLFSSVRCAGLHFAERCL